MQRRPTNPIWTALFGIVPFVAGLILILSQDIATEGRFIGLLATGLAGLAWGKALADQERHKLANAYEDLATELESTKKRLQKTRNDKDDFRRKHSAEVKERLRQETLVEKLQKRVAELEGKAPAPEEPEPPKPGNSLFD